MRKKLAKRGITVSKLDRESKRFVWGIEYANEWGNQLIYLIFFVAAFFGLVMYWVIAMINPDVLAPEIRTVLVSMVILGFVLVGWSIYRRSRLESEIRKELI